MNLIRRDHFDDGMRESPAMKSNTGIIKSFSWNCSSEARNLVSVGRSAVLVHSFLQSLDPINKSTAIGLNFQLQNEFKDWLVILRHQEMNCGMLGSQKSKQSDVPEKQFFQFFIIHLHNRTAES